MSCSHKIFEKQMEFRNIAVNQTEKQATITTNYKTTEKTIGSEEKESKKRKSSIIILKDYDLKEFLTCQLATKSRKGDYSGALSL